VLLITEFGDGDVSDGIIPKYGDCGYSDQIISGNGDGDVFCPMDFRVPGNRNRGR